MLYTLRRGFTMLELVMVIVILGIVSSIGAEIIANVYEGYIVQRAQHRASIKTELAATQIANRLAYAIPGTVVRKHVLGDINGTDITQVAAGNPRILQWVGADMDSFNASSPVGGVFLPGWSGFCDLDASPQGSMLTPGSNLGLTGVIRNNLGMVQIPRIYFPRKTGLYSSIIAAMPMNGNSTPLVDLLPKQKVEHYKLALSSYALEARANGELWLYYNFAPLRAVAIAGNSQILLRNVTTFRFRGDGRTIRFKICVNENIGDSNISVCKEKAVF